MLFAHLLGLLLLFLFGWGLGWKTLGDWRLALFPALLTVLLNKVEMVPYPEGIILAYLLILIFLWGFTPLQMSAIWQVIHVSVVLPFVCMMLISALSPIFLRWFP